MAQATQQAAHSTHDFPALRGMQGGRACYTIMCPLRLIPRLFHYDDTELPPEERAQRAINPGRIPEIADYLTQNPDSYILPAITASLDQEAEFVPTGEELVPLVGMLRIPREARLLINDGQHRRAAIERAVTRKRELGHDSIPVLLFIDEGLKRSQQMFADLNRHAIRPSTSLNTYFDKRDAASTLARCIMEEVPCFQELTEVEKSSLPLKSRKLFTLSAIKNASWRFLEKRKRDDASIDDHVECITFWAAACKVMPDWLESLRDPSLPMQLRQGSIHAHGVFLQALAVSCSSLRREAHERDIDWYIGRLTPLMEIDWQRSNPEWEGRCLRDGRISKSHTSVELLACYLKQQLGIPLSEKQLELEGALTP
ncbi:DNA sulfur modification protein DndB [Halomonas rhizosphaerae]|uniref:DNA sulfur modification protein DndB n=1 Tax=Halomonas rhizosphaerae TaxID=3043296 RepID=A0ABT6V620_9GAMM|nr:DNA sulfur modification protein DndB [Halomonas rhizosphaerae]MDI5892938.1 DNA sulfur modification protein DndB [Halomonas rhizosphaerae]